MKIIATFFSSGDYLTNFDYAIRMWLDHSEYIALSILII